MSGMIRPNPSPVLTRLRLKILIAVWHFRMEYDKIRFTIRVRSLGVIACAFFAGSALASDSDMRLLQPLIQPIINTSRKEFRP
jgi:hypothetical protein